MNHSQSNDPTAQDSAFLEHLTQLGFATAAEYRQWCEQQGYSTKLKKDWKRRAHELYRAKQQRTADRLRLSRIESRRPLAALQAICGGEINVKDIASPHFRAFAQSLNDVHHEPNIDRAALTRLVTCAHQSGTKFFEPNAVDSYHGNVPGNTFLEAFGLLARHARHWIRPVESWRRRTRNTRRAFRSLLHHLVVRYDAPEFFDRVWFGGQDQTAAEVREWYLQIAAGQSIRDCKLPLKFTKRMGHFFMRAPSHLTVHQALRFGQVLGQGGDRPLAKAILGSRIGSDFSNESFWATVVQWFVHFPTVDRHQVAPIIDFLHFQRFVTPTGADQPEQPNLCMKQRFPEKMLRDVARWHRHLQNQNHIQIPQWRPSSLMPFSLVEGPDGNQRHWTIRELISSSALMAEGRKLKHCVASYAPSCARGRCSIWTLEVRHGDQLHKLVTLEVSDSRQKKIVQARGKLNRSMTDVERSIVRRWATREGMKIGPFV